MLRIAGVTLAALAFAPVADAARFAVSAAVEPGAHAATFRWSTRSPARVTVEVGRTPDYGIWLRTPAKASRLAAAAGSRARSARSRPRASRPGRSAA
jgi:hypothetical protein